MDIGQTVLEVSDNPAGEVERLFKKLVIAEISTNSLLAVFNSFLIFPEIYGINGRLGVSLSLAHCGY
jgi:hypothetical protein